MTDLIRRELRLSASPDEVWRALTEPDRLRGWLADEVSFEPWPGGEAVFKVDGRTLSGWVEEIRAPAGGRHEGRLAFWWGEGDGPASRVALTVAPAAGGTLLRVCETRPLDVVELVGIPLTGPGGRGFGPALAACAAA
ncbi:MAG TPA: SRPBCC domain-containing protein [Solirubrobacteraceae bacterium]|nr:SRPBCC domain-containing protein [Solirubrobacteraceae bacterium]